jgi:hypothetical protein
MLTGCQFSDNLPIQPDIERVKKFLLIFMYCLIWLPLLFCMCIDAVIRDYFDELTISYPASSDIQPWNGLLMESSQYP